MFFVGKGRVGVVMVVCIGGSVGCVNEVCIDVIWCEGGCVSGMGCVGVCVGR